MNETYSIESGNLVVRDPNTEAVVWSGTFDGCPLLKIVPLRVVDGCLILLDWSGSQQPTFENLLLITGDGSVTWRVPLPDLNDTYVDVRLTDTGIAATTWTGFIVAIDPSNKTVRRVNFTK